MTTIKTEIANYFKDQEGIVAVYLFGSHAAKSPQPFSDIDIGIIAEYGDTGVIRNKFGLYSIDLGRMLRKDIHPVMLNFASERLLSQVFVKGKCLVVNNRRALSEFRMMGLVRIADFGYYKDKMQEGFIQRLMEV